MFEKGKSGNPAGRPKKGNALTDLLELKLDKEKFIEAVIASAYAGEVSIQKYIWERLEGRLPDVHELAGIDGENFKFDIVIRTIEKDK